MNQYIINNITDIDLNGIIEKMEATDSSDNDAGILCKLSRTVLRFRVLK